MAKVDAVDSSIEALVTVIMPVYNTPANLFDRATDSVLTQSHKSLELLLVDDGSDAICASRCDSLARQDDRVRVFHQSNAGVSAARNAALDVARGEWVMFVDADDELLPGAIERSVSIGTSKALDILYGEIVISESGNRFLHDFGMRAEGELVVREDPDYLKALETYFLSYESMNRQVVPRTLSVGPCSRVFRNRSIGTVRFDTRLRILEDAMFNSIVVSGAKRVGFDHEPWYVYHKYHGSATHTMSFKDGSQEHCEVVRESVMRRNISIQAYYSQVCTYFFFTLHSLSVAGDLTYEALREGYDMPWFKEAFAELNRQSFDYPTTFEKLKYRIACNDHPLALWLLYKARYILKCLLRR